MNLEHLRRIAGELGVPVQYGGGLRSAEAVHDALAAGAARVILGTAAFTDPELLREVLDAHEPDAVLVAVDVRGGLVATHGWLQTTDAKARDAFAEPARAAACATSCTPTSTTTGCSTARTARRSRGRRRRPGTEASIFSGGIGSARTSKRWPALRRARARPARRA